LIFSLFQLFFYIEQANENSSGKDFTPGHKMKQITYHACLCWFIVTTSLYFSGCNGKLKNENAKASVANGEVIFNQNCTSCHSIHRDGIGPALGGITHVANDEWIKKFITNPKAMIQSGDERSAVLMERYTSIMPSFEHYTENDLDDIVAFLHTQTATTARNRVDPLALKNPIPASIPRSDLVVEIREVTTIPPSSNEGQLTRICKLDYRPDTKTVYVVDLRGKLYELYNNRPRIYLDMAKERPNFIHKPGLATGFGSFAFHPGFSDNGLLYTTHAEAKGSAPADFSYDDSIKVMLQWVLTEWKTDKPQAFPFQGKGRELLRINMVHSYHGAQEIAFNPFANRDDEDYGLLYMGIGDGSSVEFGFPFLAHSRERIWGTIIRIDPSGRNSRNGKYGIPPTNPFVGSGNPNTLGEIYAYGFRNPHRISWTKRDKMLATNIGHHNIESLNLIEGGRDYGWPIREGSFLMDLSKGMHNIYPLPEDDEKYGVTYPVAEYDHDEGNAISGGYEYLGSRIPELKGKYLFGDIVNGRLFYIETDMLNHGARSEIKEWQVSIDGEVKTLTQLCSAEKVDVRFGRGADGEMYILTKPDGKVYQLTRIKSR
jgi:glucose/arabinose dehydrogenase/mono/diheme cytochrome c family protein